jgi:hypothetical protein
MPFHFNSKSLVTVQVVGDIASVKCSWICCLSGNRSWLSWKNLGWGSLRLHRAGWGERVVRNVADQSCGKMRWNGAQQRPKGTVRTGSTTSFLLTRQMIRTLVRRVQGQRLIPHVIPGFITFTMSVIQNTFSLTNSDETRKIIPSTLTAESACFFQTTASICNAEGHHNQAGS